MINIINKGEIAQKGKLVYKAEGYKDKENMLVEIQTAMQKINEAK